MRKLPGSAPPRLSRQAPVKPAPPSTTMRVTLVLRRADPEGWQKLRHRALNRREEVGEEEFAAAFGADPQEVAAVEAFARDHGLTVVSSSAPRRTVVVEAGVELLEELFGVELGLFEVEGQHHLGHSGPVSVDERIAEIVTHVVGLHQLPIEFLLPVDGCPKCDAPKYTPQELAELYDFPEGQGGGQTIGISILDGGFYESDLEAYFAALGLSMPKITVAEPDRNQPAPEEDIQGYLAGTTAATAAIGWTIETTMDIEIAGALANEASFIIYFARENSNQGIHDLLLDVLYSRGDRPQVLNCSWGLFEGKVEASYVEQLEEILEALAVRNTTVCVAAGDSGSNPDSTSSGSSSSSGSSGNSGALEVMYPASSAYVVSCGGTRLEGSDGSIHSETVWNAFSERAGRSGATGGGVSALVAAQDWQASAEVKSKTEKDGRGLPDVASVADPSTGIKIRVAGVEFASSGTSACAPVWSALVGRLNGALGRSVGFLTSILYQEAAASTFRGVTEGNNFLPKGEGPYNAGAGWDPCTGWGSPQGKALLKAVGDWFENNK